MIQCFKCDIALCLCFQLGSSSKSLGAEYSLLSVYRSRSVERVMEHRYDFDLTYITERIICVFFPELDEPQYHHNIQEVALMLKNKHHDKFLLLNLSEKRHDICKLHPKVQDFGWPDLHAPPLDRICSVCKAMDSWLCQDPQNVVVLHCKVRSRFRPGLVLV
uniref:Phosphatase tensin-type domain-containing protein n=1 Tax=Periophthalmus magnuspinnatus TaxID=409849 RepID=A0A3B4BDY1_9GOBI